MPRAPQPDIAELLERMAAETAEQAPEGWLRASGGMTVHREGGSSGSGIVVDMADGGREGAGFLSHDLVQEVGGLDDTYGEDLAVEVAVEASGRFEALTSRVLSRLDGPGGEVRYLYVRDSSVPPPDFGGLQPGPEDPTQAGDPAEAVRLLWTYFEKHAELLGWEEGEGPHRFTEVLREPAAPQDVEDVEALPGGRLPEDLRALYLAADGQHHRWGVSVFDGHPWFPLETVAYFQEESPEWAAPVDTWRYHEFGRVRSDGLPTAAVRASGHRPGWIRFAESTGGDFLAVDMEPALGGRPGQVIRVGRNHYEGPALVADSVTSMLRMQVEALERGDYEVGDGYLNITSGLPYARPEPDEDIEADPASGQLTLRHAHVTSAAEMDALDGDRDVIAVTVRTDDPVSLRPLLGSPHLYGLDLHGAAEITDLGALADLPGLRYLAMRLDQWERLASLGGAPSGVAAAILTGGPTLAETAAWAELLGAGPDDLGFHSGWYASPAG